MRVPLLVAIMCAGVGSAHAGDLDIRVLLSGQVAPGVYGQVQIGNDSPPPVVYAQPMLVEPMEAPPPPIYLHVPPGHARNWRKHCHEYHACNRPVYFVRSEEYDPEYQRHYADHARERDDERRRWEDRERGDEHGRGHGNGHDGDEHGRGHGHDGRDD
ncbi:MAG TPA: hypothetical protein VKP66_02155 [Steroidobacteraceae bacterium]|nr:hypothetical protein [Steroidobacteraceae bacterium]